MQNNIFQSLTLGRILPVLQKSRKFHSENRELTSTDCYSQGQLGTLE